MIVIMDDTGRSLGIALGFALGIAPNDIFVGISPDSLTESDWGRALALLGDLVATLVGLSVGALVHFLVG